MPSTLGPCGCCGACATAITATEYGTEGADACCAYDEAAREFSAYPPAAPTLSADIKFQVKTACLGGPPYQTTLHFTRNGSVVQDVSCVVTWDGSILQFLVTDTASGTDDFDPGDTDGGGGYTYRLQRRRIDGIIYTPPWTNGGSDRFVILVSPLILGEKQALVTLCPDNKWLTSWMRSASVTYQPT